MGTAASFEAVTQAMSNMSLAPHDKLVLQVGMHCTDYFKTWYTLASRLSGSILRQPPQTKGEPAESRSVRIKETLCFMFVCDCMQCDYKLFM